MPRLDALPVARRLVCLEAETSYPDLGNIQGPNSGAALPRLPTRRQTRRNPIRAPWHRIGQESNRRRPQLQSKKDRVIQRCGAVWRQHQLEVADPLAGGARRDLGEHVTGLVRGRAKLAEGGEEMIVAVERWIPVSHRHRVDGSGLQERPQRPRQVAALPLSRGRRSPAPCRCRTCRRGRGYR